jgi:hypothetical protein
VEAQGGPVTAERPFVAFPKIPRLNRRIVVTEKIDGSNGCIVITDDDIYAQSRTRVLREKESDNFGFRVWVETHAEELRANLGVGRHFGEWMGKGIQRSYGLDHRRYYLFNTSRWTDAADHFTLQSLRVVPVLYDGLFSQYEIDKRVENLRLYGSVAVPGQLAEGIVVFHTAANILQKVLLVGDDISKGEAESKAKAQV